MKKVLMVLVLAAIIATGTAFADHPEGWGIGLTGSYGFGTEGYLGAGGGIFLKIPGVPIFWNIGVGLATNAFGLSVTGDYYIIDSPISGELGWFLGVGGFFNWFHYSMASFGIDYTYDNLAFGIRVPVGISWMPLPQLEFIADVAPSFGLGMPGSYKIGGIEYKYDPEFYWGVPIEIGFRYWF